ncbi:MAG: polysaccharide deacetylase family protein [Proteobacteria bacterium]|nr:polysaccharide deacetylase family protein [Pseudomonadota bacterium]MBU1738378.1 polysaccharide deacetylase family protein [Pseudomonadota bacterium]
MQWQKLIIPPELTPDWFTGDSVRLPLASGIRPIVRGAEQGGVFNFDVGQVIDALRQESYAPPMTSPALGIPFPYHRLPAWLRLLAARCIYLPKRLFRHRHDPPWPIAAGADLLLALSGRFPPLSWGGKWAVTITHDVDTRAGLARCLKIAELVEGFGFRSCFYIVGEVITSDPGIVRELHERGHEIGSHDLYHDNRLSFLAQQAMEDRLLRARDTIRPYNGVGFRSPSLLRSPGMLGAVGRYFDYDSSVCDTDLEFDRGCTTVFPYHLKGLLEIPITLPMDSSLLYTGHSPAEILRLWRVKCEYIRKTGGLAVLLTHAEPHLGGQQSVLGCLEEFLGWLRDQPDAAMVLPAEIKSYVNSDPLK